MKRKFGDDDLTSGLKKPKFDEMALKPFSKNFYREHPDVTSRHKADIETYLSAKQITVVGKHCPKAVFTFEEAGFPGKLFF